MLAAMGRDGTARAIAPGDGVLGAQSPRRQSGSSPPVAMGVLAAMAAALACAAVPGLLSRSSAGSLPPARHGLTSLPAAAQGPVSAALGRDEQAYRLVGLRALNPAQRLRVSFSGRGVAVASSGARFSMALSAYGYAGALRPSHAVTPRVSANRVSYDRGALSEWYANGPLGLEQGFDVGSRPGAGSGPLTFSLAISGNLTARLQGGSLLLGRRGASLRYGGLLATDARGRVLRSWLALAGGRLLIRVDDRGAAYPLRIDPFVQQAELTASNGAREDGFGEAVAISGATIVVGVRNHKVGAVETGAAYVFVEPPSGWSNATQTGELISSNGEEGDEFGRSVAISGNTIVVGANFEKVGLHLGQGEAYVFTKPAAGWGSTKADEKEEAELIATGGAMGDRLGRSVAISGKTVVAGAFGRQVGANEKQGATYVFSEPAGGWGSGKIGEEVNQAAELTASDGAKEDQLGESVAILGDTVVAGVPRHKVGGNEKQGAAYVFTMPAGGWGSGKIGEEVHDAAELMASDGAAKDGLGESVAVSAGTVLAGAAGHATGGHAFEGAAYVFIEPAGGWGSNKVGEPVTEAAELTASDGAEEDGLGESVAISGERALVGAPGHKVGANPHQGAAYLFVKPAGGWAGSIHQTEELNAEKGEAQERFGGSVAISGDTALAGAPNRKIGANEFQGAAYVFVGPPPSVAITTPASGAVYTQGQVVDASYACSAPAGATVTACAGPVANGAAIETSTLGAHAFTVEATDSDGVKASQSVGYTVVAAGGGGAGGGGAGGGGAGTAPVVSGLTQSATTWREGNALASISSAGESRRKPPVGTTFSFTLNVAASVTFQFTHSVGGRRVGGKCVAQTKRNKGKHRCLRTVIADTLAFAAHAGRNNVRFDGRVSSHKRLAPGSYKLLVQAVAAGKASATAALRFTIAVH